MQDIIARLLSFRISNIIKKGKKYLKPGQKPPNGVITHKGPHNGTYYFVEDRHVKQGGKEHELVRSRGVTKDQFKTIEEKYKSQGAESVHFVHVPGLEKNQKGENLYNIYVNWGDKTQKKIADKKEADKTRYGHPRTIDAESPEWTEKDGIHTAPAYAQKGNGYVPNGRYEIIPSGDFGAKLYHVDKQGNRNKVRTAYGKVFGEASETDIDQDKSRNKNIATLKGLAKYIHNKGQGRLKTLIGDQKRLDEERAAKPKKEKAPEKNPIWELHQTLKIIRGEKESKESKEALKDVPEIGTDPVQEYHDTKSRLLSLSSEGKVPEVEAHEEALQKRRGDTPIKEFMAGMLKRHYPEAGDDQIQEAARHALVKHTRAIADKVKTPLSDAFTSGKNWLENLKHQKVPDRITPAKRAETPASVKTPSQKPAKILTKVKPEVTGPVKPVSGFKKESDHGTIVQAERAKKKIEGKGKEAVVRERKYKKGYSVYSVYSRRKALQEEKKTPKITLPVSPDRRTWVRRIDAYVPGQVHMNIGDFVKPESTTGKENTYSLPDGIYHSGIGSRNQNPGGEKYYHVKDGQITEIPEGERFEYMKKHLPTTTIENVLDHIAKQQPNTISKPEVSSSQPENKSPSTYTKPPAKFEKRGDLILSNVNPGLKNNLFYNGYMYDEKRDEYRMPAYDPVTLNNALSAAKKFGFNPMFQTHVDKYSEEEEWKKTGMPVKPRPETKTFTISGDTFTHKDAIKRAGGQYNRDKTWQLKDRSGAVEKLKDLPGLKIEEYKSKKIESKPVPKLTEKEIHDEIAKLSADYLTTQINMDVIDTKQYLKRFREAGGKGATA